jgi:hypothetical protein
MKNTIRKYHRTIAIGFGFPLLFTAITGMGISITETWLHQPKLAAWLVTVHTFQIFKLDTILPILNGLGLVGLAMTGLSMAGVLPKHHQPKKGEERS